MHDELLRRVRQSAQVGLALALVAGAPAMAQQQTARPSIYGAGSATGGCGHWANSTPDGPMDYAYGQWLMGFLSAFNVTTFEKRNKTNLMDDSLPNESVVQSAKSYCKTHPLKSLMDATWDTIDNLNAIRSRQ